MADEDNELNVRVTTDSDVGGVTDAENALGGFKEKAGEAASEMRHFTGSSREGLEIFRAIGGAARGGAAGVGEMTRGLRSLVLVVSHSIGAGPLGVLLLTLGLIAGAFLSMKSHAKEAEGGMADAAKGAEKLKKELDEVKKSAEEDFKPLNDKLKELNEQFKELDQRIHAATEASTRQAKADEDLQKSQRELSKAKELDAATDETQRAYIEKKYAAQEKLDDAQRKLIESSDKLNELKVKSAAADDEAAKKAAVAAEGAEKVREAHDKLEDATKKAAIATSQFNQQSAASGALSAAESKTKDPATLLALSQAGKIQDTQVAAADAARRSAIDEGRKAQEDAKVKDAEQAKLQKAADDAASKADAARQAVEKEQLAATTENTAALNRVAAAIIGLKDVDKAEVTGGGQTQAEVDREKSDRVSGAKGTRPETRTQAAAEDAALNHRDAAAEKAATGAHRVKQSIDKHTRATVDAHEQTVGVLKDATKHIERTSRQLVNASSYLQSP